MQAGSKNLQKIFEQTVRYRIPLFQRPYVWNEEKNWQPLWEDIRMLSERHLDGRDSRSHFIGAIVLEQLLGSTGSIEVRQVIDGQQRLTTLQLLLAALRDLCASLGITKYQQRFAKYTSNDAAFLEDKDDQHKVWPTNRDRDDFRKTMLSGSPDELCKAYGKSIGSTKVGCLIPDGYLYFYRVISTWAGGPEMPHVEKRIEALWMSVCNMLRIVTIDLENDDDAQIIFETLNARGTKLLPADLVKNHLFHQAELRGGAIEDLYEKHWRPFDEDFWRQEIRQGRLFRPRVDLFLQNYLTLKRNDEVNAGHIFEVFKEYEAAEGRPAEDYMEELRIYGEIARTFYHPPKGSRAELFFYRLDLIDTATVQPFLLEAFRTFTLPDGEPQIRQILIDLESWLTRRMVCGLTTKNYNRFFLDAVKDLTRAGGVTPEQFRQFLVSQTSDTNRWPDDEEFRRAFEGYELYRTLTRPKLRMILEALDLAMDSEKSERIYIQSALTIEHLLPQSWQEHWPLDVTEPEMRREAIERREHLLQTIGNLTLLTQKLNSSVSKSAWTLKKPEIVKQSKLNMNRTFHDVPDWSEARIAARSRELFELAVQVWPRPAVSSDTTGQGV